MLDSVIETVVNWIKTQLKSIQTRRGRTKKAMTRIEALLKLFEEFESRIAIEDVVLVPIVWMLVQTVDPDLTPSSLLQISATSEHRFLDP